LSSSIPVFHCIVDYNYGTKVVFYFLFFIFYLFLVQINKKNQLQVATANSKWRS
jgi:hypothetical protein